MKSTSKVKEIYLPIKGFEGDYQISNTGNVKSLKWSKEKILKLIVNDYGYYIVTLCKKGKGKTYKIHQLVAAAFLGHTPSNYTLIVNHINFNKLDNRVENIELVTPRENTNRKHIKSSSKYTGVYWCKTHLKWISHIFIDRKKKHLGCFTDELQASNAYQKELSKL